jgi:hypothetical protein
VARDVAPVPSLAVAAAIRPPQPRRLKINNVGTTVVEDQQRRHHRGRTAL